MSVVVNTLFRLLRKRGKFRRSKRILRVVLNRLFELCVIHVIVTVTEAIEPFAVNGFATGAGCIPTEANVESPPYPNEINTV
jgi:hypothetical protein